jgi:hypothetical protein
MLPVTWIFNKVKKKVKKKVILSLSVMNRDPDTVTDFADLWDLIFFFF